MTREWFYKKYSDEIKKAEENIKKQKMFDWLVVADKVIDVFNFDKVHKVMKFLDWGWYGTGVPDVYTMKEKCRKEFLWLFEEMENKGSKYFSSSCGGFLKEVWIDENGEYQCCLSFVLEDAMSN